METTQSFINEFKDFALRSSSIDIAVGMLLGAGINPVANSMVNDVIMPFLSLFGSERNLKNKFVLLRSGESGKTRYRSLKEAEDDGAVVITYGKFISSILHFIVLSGSAYLFVKGANHLRNQQIKLPIPQQIIPSFR